MLISKFLLKRSVHFIPGLEGVSRDTLNSRLLRISQFKKKFSYFTRKILKKSWDKNSFSLNVNKQFEFKSAKSYFNPNSSSLLPTPPPLVFSLAFQGGDRNQCTAEFPLKNGCSGG